VFYTDKDETKKGGKIGLRKTRINEREGRGLSPRRSLAATFRVQTRTLTQVKKKDRRGASPDTSACKARRRRGGTEKSHECILTTR